MPVASRRAVLKALGVVGLGSGVAYGALTMNSTSEENTGAANATQTELSTGTETPTRTRTTQPATATPTPEPSTWRLDLLDHSQLSSSVGGFAEGSIRSDGRYAAIGTRFSGTGSYLVEVDNPAALELVHHLPAGDGDVICLGVKCGPRKGLYCRTNHPAGDSGIEIVDYGFSVGTPRSPTVIGVLDTGPTHNLCVHSDASLVYAVNYTNDPAGGFDIWDVSTPRSPRKVGVAGPSGYLHDISYDPQRELLHGAYMGKVVNGYVVFDASDPAHPVEIGRFSYGKHQSYEESEIGEEAFGNCHYALADPRRDLVVVGDETSYGVPGGKHVFDIGWDKGSPENPIPLGFTVSPTAQYMNSDSNDDGEVDELERFDWTGHQFDIVPFEDATLLTSGDWHEGTVLYNITDPTNPHPIDLHRTDETPVPHPSEELQEFGDPPMAYASNYNAKRGVALTCDLYTGIYSYDIEGVVSGKTVTESRTEG